MPRATERLRLTPSSAVAAVVLLGLTLALLRLLAAAQRVLGWVLVAAAVAGVLHPFVALLARRMPRGAAVAVVSVASLAAVFGTGYAVVSELVDQTRVLQRAAPEQAAELERSRRFGAVARDLRLAERTEAFVEEVPDRLRGGTPAEALRAATTRGVAFLATAVLTLFLLLHGPELAAAASRQVHDPDRRAKLGRIAAAAYYRGLGYARGTLGMAFVAGAVAYLLAVMADVPGPLPLALWVALWDVVPLIGAVVGGLPIVSLGAVASPGRGVALAAAFAAYEVVEIVFLQRPLERRTLRLGPFLTAAGGFAGLELYGLGGALLMTLALAMAAGIVRELTGDREGLALPGKVEPMATIQLRTSAFTDHAPIPARFSRDGDNVSPALEWSGVPEGTAELALICEDPDAPGGTFVHWVLSGLDPGRTALGEGEVPEGAVEGANDYGGSGYGGPQPPVGDPAHRYFFRLYAVAEPLGMAPGATADDLRQAVKGKELAEGVVVGTYQR